MTIVLGINGYHAPVTDFASEWRTKWYHDAAAVLVRDGRVVHAVEEERLTRNKHTGTFPSAAITSCLARASLTLEDVDLIAVGEEGGAGDFRDADLSPERIATTMQTMGLTRNDLSSRIRLVEHHKAHAASAYYPSGFDDALVLTIDGFGDGVAGLVAKATDGEIETIRRLRVDQSIGNFFAAPLPYFGYRNFDEYKLMGLASYGDPSRFASLVSELYTLLPDGDFAFRVRDVSELVRILASAGPPRLDDSDFLAHHKDLAAAYQGAFEKIVLHVLRHHAKATGLRKLCMAGGCAQNSAFNGRLASVGLFDAIFIQPASNDAGTALGAALLIAREAVDEAQPHEVLSDVCWGPDVSPPAELEQLFTQWEALVEWTCCDVVEEAAKLLVDGHVLGWVQGQSEFGPRALGSRSILADPRRPESKTRINAVIKERELYRPFAPAVIEEEAAHYFELSGAEASSAFMTFAVPVVASHREELPAITHVDGTARVQTVSKASHPRFWNLLSAFGKRSGVPILLNTSFNSRREPIVQSAHDALTCLLTSQLEYLFVNDYRVRKRPFATDVLLEMVPSIPSHVQLVLRSNREGQPNYSLVTRGESATSLSVALGRWLASQGTESVELRREVGQELNSLWVERLVALTPRGT